MPGEFHEGKIRQHQAGGNFFQRRLREANTEKWCLKPFERTGTKLERMQFCAKNPDTFLVCFIESTFRVQVNLTRIVIFNGSDFKFRHMQKIFDGLRP